MKRLKSRTFAVLMVEGERLGAYFLTRFHEIGEDPDVAFNDHLDIQVCETEWGWRDQNNLIKMLVTAGLTVRFFDQEEKQWMETSREKGYIQVPGNRDGSWGIPNLGEFEKHYLGT